MQLAFKFRDTNIEFNVIYKKRKTITIIVEAPGKVSVIAPNNLPIETIIKKVSAKSKWIIQKLYEVEKIKTFTIKKEYVNGELFMYLGRNYPLQLEINSDVTRPAVKLYHGKFVVISSSGDKQLMNTAMETWYRGKAEERIKSRVKYYETQFDVYPNKITIKDQRKRWGSCSSKGNLNFNWRLIMAPSNVLDYIIVHEMCHLIHLNHSRDFWDLVSYILPDYQYRKEWLKKNGVRLSL